MGRTMWVISDTHFGHENSWAKFKLPNGDPLRPFTSTEEMNEFMVEQWNARVRPQDHVHHLGDVVINKKYLDIVKRLNGHKRLVRGNHDIFDDKLYREAGFEKIYGVRVFTDRFILSHIPLHPDCITHRFKANVHGHTHSNRVMRQVFDPNNVIGFKEDGTRISESKAEIDPRYFSVCVEQTNYAPVSFEELDILIQKQFDDLGYVPPSNCYGNGSGPG